MCNLMVTPSLGHEQKLVKQNHAWCQAYLPWSRAAEQPVKM